MREGGREEGGRKGGRGRREGGVIEVRAGMK